MTTPHPNVEKILQNLKLVSSYAELDYLVLKKHLDKQAVSKLQSQDFSVGLGWEVQSLDALHQRLAHIEKIYEELPMDVDWLEKNYHSIHTIARHQFLSAMDDYQQSMQRAAAFMRSEAAVRLITNSVRWISLFEQNQMILSKAVGVITLLFLEMRNDEGAEGVTKEATAFCEGYYTMEKERVVLRSLRGVPPIVTEESERGSVEFFNQSI